ncbi:MAG: chain-length determining protein [Sphingomonadales bacterium]|nr:chain-length determining protein [Sphingomonadales bacterium]
MNSLYDDLRSTLYSIWQRRWLALAIAWTVCLAGWLVVAMIPNTYQANARVYVTLYDPLSGEVGIGAGDRKSTLDQVRDTLTSTAHLEQIVRGTRLGERVTSREQMESAIAALRNNIKIVADQDNLFEISATTSAGHLPDADNARLAKAIVDKVIAIFRDADLNAGRSSVEETTHFLDQQLAQRGAALQAADQRRSAFVARYPELATGGVSLVQQLETSRSELRSIEGDIAAAQSSLASVNAQLAATPATLPGTVTGGGGTRAALAQAQADLAGLRARGLTDNHPDVIEARNQITALRGELASEGSAPVAGGMPNPAYSALLSLRADRQSNLMALQARHAAVEADLNQAVSAQTSNPEIAAEAQTISRDYDVLKQQYDKLLADREALKLRGTVENSGDGAKFQVIDPPTVPHSPIAPNRALLLFAVLAVGIGAGLGAAYAVGELRSTFGTTARLERMTGLPVLGAISRSLTEDACRLRQTRLRYFFGAAAMLGVVFMMLIVVEFVLRGSVA